MPLPIPDTLDEAKRVGRPFRGSDDDLRNYGLPIETWLCSAVPAGHKCASYRCVNGWRLVRYCDTALGCTESYEVPCDD